MKRVAAFSLAIAGTAVIAACASSGQKPVAESATPAADSARRTLPYPVFYPADFEAALEDGTRSPGGVPGSGYWQQWADYTLTARIFPEDKRLAGSATIVYHNNSPDTLPVVFLQLSQNLHAEGVPRNIFEEVTGGVELSRVVAGGVEAGEIEAGATQGALYSVNGTVLGVRLPFLLMPGGAVELEIEYSFTIPRAGASSRMGWDADNLFFLAYWYPQMCVYDDVVGWQTDPFMGRAEFYMGYGDYDLTIEVPEEWVVVATGTLQNPDEVLAPAVHERLQRAERSDTIVHVIGADDFGRATRNGEDGLLAWRFSAENVRDVAFSVTRESFWDAGRTPVGDRDGDGSVDYARADALYRELAPRWKNSARYTQHAISFLSDYTGFPYPWPHMTALEGANIIGGGMEFPMFTLIGSYNQSTDSALYYVTAHEEAHMWFPMIIGLDERRYAWMDEGTTTFNENQAKIDFFPGVNFDVIDQRGYLLMARSGNEGEMMRRSDYHYDGAYGVASYSKPATMLVALRGVLGERTFLEAYRSFIQAWAYKHPYPWDLFNHFEAVSGRDLDWFWRSWYYETWTLDQAVASVTQTEDGTRIVIADLGLVPMPVHLRITLAGGDVIDEVIPVGVWLSGAKTAAMNLPGDARVVRVEIDPESAFPDVDRANNAWVP
jgi:hypothetical protein